MDIKEIPGHDQLIKILKDPNTPPIITIDLDGDDTPNTGMVRVMLDADGNLIEAP